MKSVVSEKEDQDISGKEQSKYKEDKKAVTPFSGRPPKQKKIGLKNQEFNSQKFKPPPTWKSRI